MRTPDARSGTVSKQRLVMIVTYVIAGVAVTGLIAVFLGLVFRLAGWGLGSRIAFGVAGLALLLTLGAGVWLATGRRPPAGRRPARRGAANVRPAPTGAPRSSASQPNRDDHAMKTVPGALAKFAQAVQAAPVIDQVRLRAEYEDLSQRWGGRELSSGSLAEITDILRANLERDAARPGHEAFQVDVIADKVCAQVSSIIGDRANAYRVWRTADGGALLGSHPDTITSTSADRPALAAGSAFDVVRTPRGRVVGVWFQNPADASDRSAVMTLLTKLDLLPVLGRGWVVEPNRLDERGGVVAMLDKASGGLGLRDIARKAVRPPLHEPYESLAARLAEVAPECIAAYSSLDAEQRKRSGDDRHLDSLVRSGKESEEWLRDPVEIRAIGHRLNREGGVDLMRAVLERSQTLSPWRIEREVDARWDGIGEWRG
jgi:hypothetical protein